MYIIDNVERFKRQLLNGIIKLNASEIEANLDIIDEHDLWVYISRYNRLTLDIYLQYTDKLYWKSLIHRPIFELNNVCRSLGYDLSVISNILRGRIITLSDDNIKHLPNDVTIWYNISKKQNPLTIQFIEKYKDKLNMSAIIRREYLEPEILDYLGLLPEDVITMNKISTCVKKDNIEIDENSLIRLYPHLSKVDRYTVNTCIKNGDKMIKNMHSGI